MVAVKQMILAVGMIRLFVAWSVCATGQAWATTYMVDQAAPGAADTNPGTEEQPFKTVQHAADVVNMCYTTGLGQNFPRHPLQLDHRITHQSPPPGLTIGGPMDNTIKELQDSFIGPFAGPVFCPPYKQWPALEAFWDVFWDPMVCEYTIHKPMAGHAYVWGTLPREPSSAGRSRTGGIGELPGARIPLNKVL